MDFFFTIILFINIKKKQLKYQKAKATPKDQSYVPQFTATYLKGQNNKKNNKIKRTIMSFKTRHSILFSPETERGQPYIYRKLRKQKLLQIMSISLQKFYLVHGQTGRRTDGDLPYKFCQRVDVVKYK